MTLPAGSRGALTGTQQVVLAACFILYAAIAVPLGVRRGGDLVGEFGQAERLLHGTPLYAMQPGEGAWWPPLGVAIVTPFALLARFSVPLAKACWGLFGMACLAWGVREAARRWGFGAALGAFAVTLFPIHNNFHHTNVEAPLVALLVAAAADLDAGHERRAGLWIGLAAGIKLIPGLLFPYLLLRRRWRAFAVATTVILAGTILVLLPSGLHGVYTSLHNWAAMSSNGASREGAPIAALHMQKLGRLGYALGGAPASIIALHLLAVGLVLTILLVRPGDEASRDKASLVEVGSVMALAVLMAPVGWLHTFTLVYPAWVAAFAYVPPVAERARRVWLGTLIAAGVYASTALTALHLPGALQALTFYDDTIGALVALALLAWLRIAHARQAVPPKETVGDGRRR